MPQTRAAPEESLAEGRGAPADLARRLRTTDAPAEGFALRLLRALRLSLSDEINLEQRRRGLLLGVALIPTTGLLDVLFVSGRGVARVIPWAVWSATYLVAAPLARRSGPTAMTLIGLVTSGVTAAALTVLALQSGGPTSVFFVILVLMPLLSSATTPDDTLSTAFVGVLALCGAVAVLLRRELPPGWVLFWGFVLVGSTAVAVWSSIRTRRQHVVRVSAERDRVAALEELASSERRLATAERLATVGFLAGGVAHEINNPLAVVKVNLGLIRSHLTGSSDGHVAEILSETEKATARIAAIVNRLRPFLREEPSEIAAHELKEAVRAAEEVLERDAIGTPLLRVELPDDLPKVQVCLPWMVEVLASLFSNAAAAARHGPAEPAWIRISAEAVGKKIRIRVEDNGPGIPSELLPRLFTPFGVGPFHGGLGLTLALCKEYLHRMSGSIEAANRPEGGALFVVEIPAA